MKQAKLLLLLLSFSLCGAAQESQEKMMVYNLTLDTILKADYYTVSISVSEYIQYERLSKKIVNTNLVSLDTLSKRLIRHLSNLGLNQDIQKSSVTEVDNTNGYYPSRSDRKLFQATYSFRLSQKDSVDYLFNSLDKAIISGMHVTPEVYDATVEKAKQFLVPQGMKMTDEYAGEIAKKMNQKIIKSKYTILFYDGGINSNYKDFSKKFLIDYEDIKYKLSISYTYTLAEK
jgi:hypothetical protein